MHEKKHQPVLLAETLELLSIQPNAWYVDATFGRGGHTSAILESGGNVIALDWDAEAIAYGNAIFSKQLTSGQLILEHVPFATLRETVGNTLKKHSIPEIAGVLFDFGTSSDQLTSGERGFSFMSDGALDMRMDTRKGVTAADLIAVLPEKQLAELFREFGGEHEGKAVARAIKNMPTPITTTQQLATLIERVKHGRRGHLHPATKVFQALRIAVNSELDEIKDALPQALEVVKPGGVIVTIAFHEGEDRLAKQAFKDWEATNVGYLVTDKPITASPEELAQNLNARSAKLRAFRKQT